MYASVPDDMSMPLVARRLKVDEKKLEDRSKSSREEFKPDTPADQIMHHPLEERGSRSSVIQLSICARADFECQETSGEQGERSLSFANLTNAEPTRPPPPTTAIADFFLEPVLQSGRGFTFGHNQVGFLPHVNTRVRAVNLNKTPSHRRIAPSY